MRAATGMPLPDSPRVAGLFADEVFADLFDVLAPRRRQLQFFGFQVERERHAERRRDQGLVLRRGLIGRAVLRGVPATEGQFVAVEDFAVRFFFVVLGGRRWHDGRLGGRCTRLGPLAGSQHADEVASAGRLDDLLLGAAGAEQFLEDHRFEFVPQLERRRRLRQCWLAHDCSVVVYLDWGRSVPASRVTQQQVYSNAFWPAAKKQSVAGRPFPHDAIHSPSAGLLRGWITLGQERW